MPSRTTAAGELRPFSTTKTSASSDYCTIGEVAEYLRVSAKRVRNMMAAGIFVEGQHFYRRAGLGPRFRWSRVVEWLEAPAVEAQDAIPMASQKRQVVGSGPADL